jgi:hypothetical protein
MYPQNGGQVIASDLEGPASWNQGWTWFGRDFETASQIKQVHSHHAQYCLDLAENKCKVGAAVQIWYCYEGPNQKWIWNDDDTISHAGCGPELVLAEHDDDGTLTLTMADESDKQKWTREQLHRHEFPIPFEGYHLIENQETGQVMDVAGGMSISGAHIIAADNLGVFQAVRQVWKLPNGRSGLFEQFHTEIDHFCLNLGNFGKCAAGSNVLLWKCDSDSDQIWKLHEDGRITHPACPDNLVLAIEDTGKIALFEDDGSAAMRWKKMQPTWDGSAAANKEQDYEEHQHKEEEEAKEEQKSE